MAPVAPDRANIEQDGFVFALRRRKGFLAPFVPLDGLVHGGAKIGGRRLGQGVEGRGGHEFKCIATEQETPLIAKFAEVSLRAPSLSVRPVKDQRPVLKPIDTNLCNV